MSKIRTFFHIIVCSRRNDNYGGKCRQQNVLHVRLIHYGSRQCCTVCLELWLIDCSAYDDCCWRVCSIPLTSSSVNTCTVTPAALSLTPIRFKSCSTLASNHHQRLTCGLHLVRLAPGFIGVQSVWSWSRIWTICGDRSLICSAHWFFFIDNYLLNKNQGFKKKI